MKKILIISLSLILICMFVLSSCSNNGGDKKEVMDLTGFSQTMLYSTVDNMLNVTPNDFLSKTIRLKGIYASGMNNFTNQPLNFIVVYDGTGCCTLGIEFETKDKVPESGTVVTVEGTYEKYLEEDSVYFHLVDSKVTIE